MKNSVLRLLFSSFAITILLVACEKNEEYTTRDWAGAWKIERFVSKENPEKMNTTNGSIVARDDKTVYITGDLFNLYPQLQINASTHKNNLTINYRDPALSINGSGSLRSADEIIFAISIADMDGVVENYNVTAFRKK